MHRVGFIEAGKKLQLIGGILDIAQVVLNGLALFYLLFFIMQGTEVEELQRISGNLETDAQFMKFLVGALFCDLTIIGQTFFVVVFGFTDEMLRIDVGVGAGNGIV